MVGGSLSIGSKMRVKTSKFAESKIEWRSLEREPSHPGVFVKEHILDAFGLTQQELADAIGLSRLSINEIVNGRRTITEGTALRLEKLTGASAEFWLNSQRAFSLWHARRSDARVLQSIKQIGRHD